jgi:hypothetical protein
MKAIYVLLSIIFAQNLFAQDTSKNVVSSRLPKTRLGVEKRIENNETEIQKLNAQISYINNLVANYERLSQNIDNKITSRLSSLKENIQTNKGIEKVYLTLEEILGLYAISSPFSIREQSASQTNTEIRSILQPIYEIYRDRYNDLTKNLIDFDFYNKLVESDDYKDINPNQFNTFTKSLLNLNDDKFSELQKNKAQYYREIVTKLNDYKGDLLKKISNYEAENEKLYEAAEEKDSINSLAIYFGIPGFCLTVIILFLITSYYGKRIPAETEIKNDFTKVLLEVITVLLLTLTILILGLSRILTETVLGTLIGGIAGYILNRTSSINKNS